MDTTQLITMILGYILVPVSSVVTFYAGRHARHTQNLNAFQNTMDELLKKNIALSLQVTELNNKIIELSHENQQLKLGQEQMLNELTQLKQHNRKNNTRTINKQLKQCK